MHFYNWYRFSSNPMRNDACHEKACLKFFVVVIPKEGLAGRAPSILVGYDTDYKIILCWIHRSYATGHVTFIPKEGGPRQYFFWYDNEIDLKACTWHSSNARKFDSGPTDWILDLFSAWKIHFYSGATIMLWQVSCFNYSMHITLIALCGSVRELNLCHFKQAYLQHICHSHWMDKSGYFFHLTLAKKDSTQP